MEILAVTLALILIALFSGGAYVLRDAGRQILPGARRDALVPGQREAQQLTGELHALSSEYEAQLTRMRERQGEVEAALARTQETERTQRRETDDLLGRIRRLGDELEVRLDEFTEVERRNLRSSGASGQLGAGSADGASGLHLRRADALGELYQRLARVEFTIATLTNPILLPGEALRVPDELPPELMKWDNWKDVGETAFALGDYFNQHRHLLDETSARAMEACIATVRETLTQRVYPNLAPFPTSEQIGTIKGALGDLTVVSRLRRYLEAQYRTLAGIASTSTAERADDDPIIGSR